MRICQAAPGFHLHKHRTVKQIRIQPIRLTKLSSQIGRPTATGSMDRRYATGVGRTFAQQMADANKRRYF